MSNIEKKLEIEKMEIDNIVAPEDMEDRLRSALNKAEKPRNSRPIKTVAAVAAAMLLTFGVFNYDVLGYYAKKIVGYDELTSFSALGELNESGFGQEINKSYTFKNGVKVGLDGVIKDDNKLIAMYTLEGDADKLDNFQVFEMEGMLGRYHHSSGRGIIAKDGSKISWVSEFQAPKAFDKNLRLTVISMNKDESEGEIARIPFKLDLSRAVAKTIKVDINKTVDVEGKKFRFETITATPLSSKITGTITGAGRKDEPGVNQLQGIEAVLYETYEKDGKIVRQALTDTGSGSGDNGFKRYFSYEFDGLKQNMTKLELMVQRYKETKVIDKRIDVSKGIKNKVSLEENGDAIIKDVSLENNKTTVTMLVKENVECVRGLLIDGKDAPIESEERECVTEGGEKYNKVTTVYEGVSDDMKLCFKGLEYSTPVGQNIVIYEK